MRRTEDLPVWRFSGMNLAAEKGSFMLFFAAGLLPFLLFILALSVDLTTYLREDQKLQEAADQAALTAWRYLPYQEKAREAARRFIAEKGLAKNILNIGLSQARPNSQQYNDEFEVLLQHAMPLQFISMILPDLKIPIRAVARTRSTPKDVFIAFDRSLYMAASTPSEPLNNPIFIQYFRDQVPFVPFMDVQSGQMLDSVPTAFMTQLCFNKYYSAVKKAAITVYEYFSAAGRNGVGLGVFPGLSGEGLRIIRPFLRPAQNAVINDPLSGEGFPLQISATANDQDYYIYNGARLGASSWCAGAAANELDNQVKTPDIYDYLAADNLAKIWRKPASAYDLRSEVVMNLNDALVFNPDYQPGLTVKEIAWSAVVKRNTANSKAVLDVIFSNLMLGPDSEEENGRALRGGLAGTSARLAIIIAGDVPYFNGNRFADGSDAVAQQLLTSLSVIRQVLSENPALRFRLVYVLINDPARHAANTPLDIRTRADNFAGFLADNQAQEQLSGRLQLDFLYSENTEAMLEELLAAVVLEDTNKVLAF